MQGHKKGAVHEFFLFPVLIRTWGSHCKASPASHKRSAQIIHSTSCKVEPSWQNFATLRPSRLYMLSLISQLELTSSSNSSWELCQMREECLRLVGRGIQVFTILLISHTYPPRLIPVGSQQNLPSYGAWWNSLNESVNHDFTCPHCSK